MKFLGIIFIGIGKYVAYIFRAIVLILVAVIRITMDTASNILMLLSAALLYDTEEFESVFRGMLKKID